MIHFADAVLADVVTFYVLEANSRVRELIPIAR